MVTRRLGWVTRVNEKPGHTAGVNGRLGWIKWMIWGTWIKWWVVRVTEWVVEVTANFRQLFGKFKSRWVVENMGKNIGEWTCRGILRGSRTDMKRGWVETDKWQGAGECINTYYWLPQGWWTPCWAVVPTTKIINIILLQSSSANFFKFFTTIFWGRYKNSTSILI